MGKEGRIVDFGRGSRGNGRRSTHTVVKKLLMMRTQSANCLWDTGELQVAVCQRLAGQFAMMTQLMGKLHCCQCGAELETDL